MPNLILGIDPGKDTGIALYNTDDQILEQLTTIEGWQMVSTIMDLISRDKLQAVVFEDIRKQSHIFNKGNKLFNKTLAKRGRNVGSIDTYCEIIEKTCNKCNIPCYGLSPKEKGAKWEHKKRDLRNGCFLDYFPYWKGKTNEHNRDAAKLLVMLPIDVKKLLGVNID
jgi:hypothetical protein